MNLSRPAQNCLALLGLSAGLVLSGIEPTLFLCTAYRSLTAATLLLVVRSSVIYALSWLGMLLAARWTGPGFDDLGWAAVKTAAIALPRDNGRSPRHRQGPNCRGFWPKLAYDPQHDVLRKCPAESRGGEPQLGEPRKCEN